MATITAIVFLVSACNYSAPLSMTSVQSIYFNQLQTTLATCTKNKYVMDKPNKHKFVELSVPCSFQAAFDGPRTIDIKDYNASTSTSYAYELMLYAISKYDISNYQYQMMILPKMPFIYYAGLGTLGYSLTWYIGAEGFSQRVFAHEFGHNIGFGHSGRNGQEYGDDSCVMGSSQWTNCYTAPHRYIAGFDKPQTTFNKMPSRDVIINKPEYIVINNTLFFEAKASGVFTYFLTEGNRTCSICTLYKEGQSCVIKALDTNITLVSLDDSRVILRFSPSKNNTVPVNKGGIDLCQPTNVIPPQPEELASPPMTITVPPQYRTGAKQPIRTRNTVVQNNAMTKNINSIVLALIVVMTSFAIANM